MNKFLIIFFIQPFPDVYCYVLINSFERGRAKQIRLMRAVSAFNYYETGHSANSAFSRQFKCQQILFILRENLARAVRAFYPSGDSEENTKYLPCK